jgi:NADP-dependent 3-hydroxy acid dehydrogenase YdfG
MKRTAWITGATAGIGEATARRMANNGFRLIISGRRKDRLEKLAYELNKITETHVVCLDVRDRDAVFKAVNELPNEWQTIDILINNAGLAVGLNPLHEGEPEDWDRMIDTNIKGVLNMLKAVTPKMIERKKGHIVQISSIASKEVYPNGNVYCATKHALDAITQSIRMELLPYHIKVSSIHPGMVETEFSLVRFKGDAERAANVYKPVEALKAEDVADTILYCLNAPDHVSIHELVVMPAAQATVRLVRKKDGSI